MKSTIYFSYSPQRSSDTRIDYKFETLGRRVIAIYRTGKEITERNGGHYEARFQEYSREEFVLSFSLVASRDDSLPGRLLVDRKVVDGNFHLTLLKPYGPEEEHNLAITFPGWNRIDDDGNESSVNRKTSLSDFQRFALLWMNQLSEIKCQTYNLSCYLAEEYKNLNSEIPPFPSPISIRSLKVSILNNVILYIEASANFLSAIAININSDLPGSPTKKHSLSYEDLIKLAEAKGKHERLEEKLVFSPACISKLIGKTVEIKKSDNNWSVFKDFKKRRDSMTHIKSIGEDEHGALSLDSMVASVRITDSDLVRSVELLCWFNNLLNEVARSVGSERFPNFHNFNDYTVGLLVNITSSIASTPNRPILNKYNVESFG